MIYGKNFKFLVEIIFFSENIFNIVDAKKSEVYALEKNPYAMIRFEHFYSRVFTVDVK